MKKLFFLCAFLFISMQIQAQMYTVSYHSWTGSYESVDSNGKKLAGHLVETIMTPDGSISQRILDEYHLDKNIDPITGILNIAHSTLNEIMKKGYTLLAIENGVRGLFTGPFSQHGSGAIFFLVKE